MTINVNDCFFYIKNGANIKQGVISGGIPITRIETLANDTFNRDKMGYAGIHDKKKYTEYILQDGDILMSHINSMAYLGRAVMYKMQKNECIIHGMNLLRLKANRNFILPEYAEYYFKSNTFKKYIKKIAKKSVNQASFSIADLKSIPLFLPNMVEQKKIYNTLNRIDNIISLKNQQLKKLDLLTKSLFVEMFGDPVDNPRGWETKGLLELGKCKNGMNFSAGESGVNVHCLGVGDFKDYSKICNTSVLPKISLNKMPPEEAMLQDGDIVFVRSNGNKMLVGRCLVIFPGDIPTTYSGFCIRFRKEAECVDTTYLVQLLKADSTRSKMAGRGANIQNLNQHILGALQIPIPPIELQQEFKDFIKQSDKHKSVVQKSLDETQLLFDSLMQKYFG